MGKIPMGILGPLSQSVGSVTGASNKGRPTLRRKSDGGVNPRTAAQVEKRSAFAEASEYCRENRDAIIAQEHFKEKKGLTIWNQMMSWYMAGGRLTPTGPQYIDDTFNGHSVKRLLNWEHRQGTMGLEAGLPLEGIAPAEYSSIYVSVTGQLWGGEVSDPVVSLAATVVDGVAYMTAPQANYQFFTAPLALESAYEYYLIFYDSNNQPVKEVYVVLYEQDTAVHLADAVPSRTNLQLAAALSSYGSIDGTLMMPKLEVTQSLDTTNDGEQIPATIDFIGKAVWGANGKLTAQLAKSTGINIGSGAELTKKPGVQGAAIIPEWDALSKCIMAYKVYNYVVVSIASHCPMVGNKAALNVAFLNTNYDAEVEGGEDCENETWTPEEFKGIYRLWYDGSKWNADFGSDTISASDYQKSLHYWETANTMFDWEYMWSNKSGSLKKNSSNWSQGRIETIKAGDYTHFRLYTVDEPDPMASAGDKLTSQCKFYLWPIGADARLSLQVAFLFDYTVA